jgi:hypothetical protein
VVALLTVGSAKAPREDVLQIGDAGKKQLVTVQQEGELGGLARYFAAEKGLGRAVLDAEGLPPTPTPVHWKTVKKYELTEQSYENK